MMKHNAYPPSMMPEYYYLRVLSWLSSGPLLCRLRPERREVSARRLWRLSAPGRRKQLGIFLALALAESIELGMHWYNFHG